jgi:integrase
VVGGQRIDGTTKSGRTRVVTIDDATAAVLREHRQRQAAERERLGDAWQGDSDGSVFTTGWGGPLYPDTATALMGKIIRIPYERPDAAQLPPARLHGLRHLHATTLLLAGVPVHVVAARLGHPIRR